MARLFGPADPDPTDAALTDSCTSFYKANDVPDNDRLPAFTVNMCGDRKSRVMHMKAGKAKVHLPWVVDILKTKGGAQLLDSGPLGREGSTLLECGNALLEYYRIVAREPRQVGEAGLAHLEWVILRATSSWRRSGNFMPMKWHVFAEHFVDQIAYAGLRPLLPAPCHCGV